MKQQSALMIYDPATRQLHPYPSHAAQYRAWHGQVAWLYNPWTGAARDPRDIGTDVLGHLILPPGGTSLRSSGGAMSREGAAVKLLRDAALWKEHDEWVKYKCNAKQMPRYAMLEAYGSPPIEKAVQAALDAAYAAGLREGLKDALEIVQEEAEGGIDLADFLIAKRLAHQCSNPQHWDEPHPCKLCAGERRAQQAEGWTHGTHEQRGRTGGGVG